MCVIYERELFVSRCESRLNYEALTVVYLKAVNVCGFASCAELIGIKSVEVLDHRFCEKQPLVGSWIV